ncbi:MAG: hypothetical protein ACM359_14405 [Bacillota bacterium]
MTHSHRPRTHYLKVAVVAALGMAPSAWAQQTLWQHDPRTPGDWFDPANWSQGVPSAQSTAVIDNTGTTLIRDSSPTAHILYIGSSTGIYGIGGCVQQTGGSATFDYLNMGNIVSGSARYYLQGGQLLVNQTLQLAPNSGTAQFIQEANTSSTILGALRVGQTGEGTYELRGGELTTGGLSVRRGTFRQLAGTHTTGNVLLNSPYILQSGSLSARSVDLQSTNLAFQQAAGTVHIDTSLTLSYGTYALESGTLAADTQTLKTYTSNNQTYAGVLRQTGGTNTTNTLDVQRGARYELAGGSLHVGQSMFLGGTLDFANGTAALDIGPQVIAIWAPGTVTNTNQATLSVGPESLLILPRGFDPASAFHSFENQGLVHQVGTTLLIDTNQTVRGIGVISDPVEVRGTLAATPGGKIDLTGPLTVSGGLVDLGTGKFWNAYNAPGGISAGKLIATAEQHDGNSHFLQTGGEHTVKSLRTSSDGTYELAGGQLTADTATVGNFTHTGGTFTVQRTLSARTYDMSGQAQLEAGELSINGTFHQSGGTSSLGTLTVSAYDRNATSIYELSGGQLTAYEERFGIYYAYGASLFRQTGGIHNASIVMLGGSFQNPHTYELSNGQFHAGEMEIAYRYDFRGNGGIIQTGGALSIDHLRIGKNGHFEFKGGSLSLGNDINVAGAFDLGGQDVSLTFGPASILDFGHGQLLNTQSASLHLGSDSLLVVPPGFDPATAFRSFSNLGLTHVGGTPLVLAPNQSFSGSGVLNDPVQLVGGSITIPTKGRLEFAGGLSVLPTGSINAQGKLVIGGASTQTGGDVYARHFILAHDFTQRGGTVDATLLSTSDGYGYGVYNLVDGELRTRDAKIAYPGYGHFVQDGGVHRVAGTLTVYGDNDNKGLGYQLNAGRLEAQKLVLGDEWGYGRFMQAGGTNLTNTLLIGPSARYSLTAGTLQVTEASLDGGTLTLTSTADLRITRRLTLNQQSHLQTSTSATVHFLAADFENHQTSAYAANELQALNLIFESNTDRWSTLEVASQLRDTAADPYLANFALGTLTIGGETPGRLRLVDLFDNQAGPEGLYVDHLIMNPGSILDLNGIALHYRTATLAPGAVILVPEPAAPLLALAVLLGLRRHRRAT